MLLAIKGYNKGQVPVPTEVVYYTWKLQKKLNLKF